MKKSTALIALSLIVGASYFSCSKEKMPNRDYIPVLKEGLYKLQVAVKEKNRVSLDSLLSVSILDNDQNSETFLDFCYNYGDSFYPFDRFGDYEISYTDDKARIDCFVMDSTSQRDRPITLTYLHEHGLWLLKKYEIRTISKDSLLSVPGS